MLSPGTRLRSEEIASELGLSRMPVREALRRLDSEGLVTLRPNRGAVVAGFTAAELFELFEIRSMLEGLAVRLAAPIANAENAEEMSALLNRMARAADDQDKWIERHWEFHAYICGLAKRQRLLREIERLHNLLEPYMRIWLSHVPKQVNMLQDHQQIIDVILARDVEKAESVMRDHVLNTAPALVTFLKL